MEIGNKVIAVGLNEDHINKYLEKDYKFDFLNESAKEIADDFRALKFPLNGIISEIYDDYFVVKLEVVINTYARSYCLRLVRAAEISVVIRCIALCCDACFLGCLSSCFDIVAQFAHGLSSLGCRAVLRRFWIILKMGLRAEKSKIAAPANPISGAFFVRFCLPLSDNANSCWRFLSFHCCAKVRGCKTCFACATSPDTVVRIAWRCLSNALMISRRGSVITFIFRERQILSSFARQ